ncbi:MAG: AbrB/MazE/SpoVT family DNA-binding domain-containing protein, partial [Chloroflexota bacterium]
MATRISLTLGQRGVLTLPKSLREQYSFEPGNSFALLDLGGVFVLSPRSLQIDELSTKITRSLLEKGEDLEHGPPPRGPGLGSGKGQALG